MDLTLQSSDMESGLRGPGLCLLRRSGSSQNQREFEFHMSTAVLQREAVTSPADELFYMGKLLPLHLPPRMEMVERLLTDPVPAYEEELYGSLVAATAPASTAVSTPFGSPDVSPCGSCGVSGELIPEMCSLSLEYSTRMAEDCPKRSWSRNVGMIKRRLFGRKRKGPRPPFFMSLIGKSGCLDDSAAAAAKGFISASSRRRGGSLNRIGDGFRQAVQPKQDLATLPPEEGDAGGDFDPRRERRSFSLSSRWRQSNKICSSSFSSSSSSSCSSSTSSSKERPSSWERSRLPCVETESPIQAAIAYCKQSQSQNPKRELGTVRGNRSHRATDSAA